MSADQGDAPGPDHAGNSDTEKHLRTLGAIRAGLDHDQLSELDAMIEDVGPEHPDSTGVDADLDRAAGRGAPVPDPGDDELVARWRQGDDQAFVEIVRRHRGLLWNVALSLVGDRDEAADALQDAFASAHHAVHSLVSPPALKPWLVAIVTTKCRQITAKRSGGVVDADTPPSLHRAITRIELERVADRLGVDDLMMATLVLVLGYDRQLAAELLGVSTDTVRRRLDRVRVRLDRELGSSPQSAMRNP